MLLWGVKVAQKCELEGILIRAHLTKLINQNDVGLIREHGLIVVKSLNSQQTNRLRKNIVQVFKNLCFKREIKTDLIEVDSLNVTFSLQKAK